nr:MarR family transcriptional regulator [Angustibacter aerolatus]
MTATQPDAARCGPDGVDEGVVGQITRLMRQLGSIKAHVSQRRRHGVEYSAYVLLFHLIRHGAMRSSALAEAVVSDPSTVSRQTASLVDLGLVERLPDPADRRAVLLAPTPAGVEPVPPDARRARRDVPPAARRLVGRRRPRPDPTAHPIDRRHGAAAAGPDQEPHGEPMTTDAPAGTSRASRPPAMDADAGLSHRQIVTILVGLMMGMFLAALDQTIVGTAIRTIGDDLHGLSVQAWVTTAYLITSTIATPLYGKPVRHLRAQAVLHPRHHDLHHRVGRVRVRDVHVHARRLPRPAGSGRRRPVLAGPRDHRRHRAAAAARQVPGLLPRGVRHLERARPGHRRLLRRRRLDPRHHRLALGLPGQRADRHRRAVRREPHPQHRARQARPPHRLLGCRRARRRPGAAADRRRAGPRVGLGRHQVARLLRRRRHRRHRVPAGRARHGRRGPHPAAPLQGPDGLGEHHRQRRPRHGPVRWRLGAAAVPADRQGRLADRVWPAAAAADARHHERLDHLRSGSSRGPAATRCSR